MWSVPLRLCRHEQGDEVVPAGEVLVRRCRARCGARTVGWAAPPPPLPPYALTAIWGVFAVSADGVAERVAGG